MSLPRKNRLGAKKDWAKTWQIGRKVSNAFFLTRFLKNGLSFSRWAIVVPRTVAVLATERHKLKRKITTALLKINWPSGWDSIVITKPALRKKNFKEIIASLEEILKKSNLV